MNDNEPFPPEDFETAMNLFGNAMDGHKLHPVAVAEAAIYMGVILLLASEESGVIPDAMMSLAGIYQSACEQNKETPVVLSDPTP